MINLKAYYELCKPNVVLTMLVTALVGSLLASEVSYINFELILTSLIGIGLCACSAAAINQVIDRKIDANMSRTKGRPLPTGEIPIFNAILFSLFIGVSGFYLLLNYVNVLTAYLTIASLIGYAFVYTIYLKRATPQNIVIGGLAGAAPPLLGWTSISGSIHPNSLLLVLIIFAWTPPHFWALAVHRKDEYAQESIPMLPVTHGIKFTKLQIILYTIILFLVSLFPYLVMMSGTFYLISATVLGSIFLYLSIKFFNDASNALALPTFNFSIYYILLIFLALLVDHFLL
ncbi:MAG: heme o synthase [Pseudomonadota bacterium]|jgi:protoheme IX farnesyltransferase|nr:protoheme IX farnesyltransferase [Gammaproteobacteria bacterium]MDC2971952.1 heme o synthase [Gammaproteobacteria bacterium]MEC8466099.1 heme o synthase [Pseudomonadota bacterium]GIS25648.1 MAG: protoheme IX farnesyltransferase [Gammaproteobacteria bacterium]|tara:strand:- start:303 stop:1166 length:864 start_codon:yes stop_codon:yes gene_type:complete